MLHCRTPLGLAFWCCWLAPAGPPPLVASSGTPSVVIPVAPPKGMTWMLRLGWAGASPSGNVGSSWSAVWILGPHSLHLA